MPITDRHSGLGRSAASPHPQHYQHSKHQEHHAGAGMTDDQAEALAEKIIEVGGGYIVAKTEAKYAPDDVPSGIGAVASGPEADALAKKIIKEAAREMERAQGTVTAGSDAALAQSVVHHIDDPSAPEHKVYTKVLERIQGAEEHARHHTFQSPNPDLGSEPSNARVRHLKGNLNTDFVTTGYRDEKNPDVKPPRH